MSFAIADKTVLVTGANRGLGRALVEEALSRGAKRVYAASRQPMVVPDERVTPLILGRDRPGADPGGRRRSRITRRPDQQRRCVGPGRLERSLCVRAAPGGQPVRDPGCHSGVPAVADAQPRSRGQRRVARRGRRGPGAPGLLGLQGSFAVAHPVAARAVGRPGRERLRRLAGSDRYRHGAGPGHPEDAAWGRCAGAHWTAWSGARRRSSPTRCRSHWQTVGARAWRRSSSARTRRWCAAEPIAA